MRRREFIGILGGAAAWPTGLQAQSVPRIRRIGVLTPLATSDLEHRARMAAFVGGLEQLGWAVGHNLQVETRGGSGLQDVVTQQARELVAWGAEAILATGGSVVGPLLQVTRSMPVVFTQTPDPVGAGFVQSLARPGGNATGFTLFEYETSGKWLELLGEVAPDTKRVAVLLDTKIPQGEGQLAVLQSVAPSRGLKLTPVDLRDAGDIERAIVAFADQPNGGLIVTASGLSNVHRELIIALAARHRLPAVYFNPLFASGGGLICYGPDSIDPHRRAAAYLDRILKGESPANLPVQAPTKYTLTVNLKTAKALGLAVPPSLLARATEVIE